MNIAVTLDESLHIVVSENLIEFTESLTQESIESGVRSLIHATIDNHIYNLMFIACSDIEFENFCECTPRS